MPTLTIAGTIAFPLAAEATPPSRPFTASLIYDEKSDDEVKLVGAQADVDLMGNISDAKACYVEAIVGDGTLKVNGATVTIPVGVAGGFWIWFNPGGGLTALTVTTTADATFRVYLFS
jgi:hypothetical protein